MAGKDETCLQNGFTSLERSTVSTIVLVISAFTIGVICNIIISFIYKFFWKSRRRKVSNDVFSEQPQELLKLPVNVRS
jgi:hypothetical protein